MFDRTLAVTQSEWSQLWQVNRSTFIKIFNSSKQTYTDTVAPVWVNTFFTDTLIFRKSKRIGMQICCFCIGWVNRKNIRSMFVLWLYAFARESAHLFLYWVMFMKMAMKNETKRLIFGLLFIYFERNTEPNTKLGIDKWKVISTSVDCLCKFVSKSISLKANKTFHWLCK